MAMEKKKKKKKKKKKSGKVPSSRARIFSRCFL
jgi:hypothetical protein